MPPCGYGRASAEHYGNGIAVGFLRPCLSGRGKRVERSHATFGDGREHWLSCLLALCRSHVCYGHLPAMPPSRPCPKGHAAALTQMFALWISCSLCARAIRPSKPGDDRAGAISRRSNARVLGRAKLREDARSHEKVCVLWPRDQHQGQKFGGLFFLSS
jgi:hypothetical protein